MLAAVGIYGVVSFGVSRRSREIGIRLALGAERGRVATLLLREGTVPALLGVVVALPATVLLSDALSGLLFEVSPRDPVVYGSVAAVLLAVAVASTWLPARRATRLSPTEALQSD